jgi:hypothetical protein
MKAGLLNKIKKHYKQGTLLKAGYGKLSSKNNLFIYSRDIKNKIIYGKEAPVFAERIWINPLDCCGALAGKYILNGVHQRKGSGLVVEYPWPQAKVISVIEVDKIRFSVDHWVNGIPWEDTGIYELMQKIISTRGKADGCRSIDDLVRRYNDLDLIFNQIKREGRLKTRKEINPGNFREKGGILIHIGPKGGLFFGGGGAHRFAIALTLQLKKIPAQVGYVHKSAIPFLPELRKQ